MNVLKSRLLSSNSPMTNNMKKYKITNASKTVNEKIL